MNTPLTVSYGIASLPATARGSRGLVNGLWLGSSVLAVCGIGFSGSPVLWIGCAVSLPIALEIAGGRSIKPIVAACLGLFWMAIFSSILIADLNSQSLDWVPTETTAIMNSLLALFAIALGFALSSRFFHRHAVSDGRGTPFKTRKLLIAYWAAFFAMGGLGALARAVPSFAQGILALQGVELLLLYLLTAQILGSKQNYVWLFAAVVAEVALGAVGYIASYQIPLIVVLAAALGSSSLTLRFNQVVFAGAFAIALIFISVVWTAVKPDYRYWLEVGDPAVTQSVSGRINWLLDRMTSGEVDYTEAAVKLASRLGYTRFYAIALPRIESESYSGSSYWKDAVENVLKPRFLFPDKPALDDTRITSELTGIEFGTGVSVSIGFVAQAHSDFGFPLMYVPLALVGLAMGTIGRYFQSRNLPMIAKDGFMTTALVYKFTYESNIDKAIGGLLLSAIVLLLLFWTLYSPFERWACRP